MATGRTVNKYCRVYVDGYDLSGYSRSIGPLAVSFAEGNDDPMNAAVIGVYAGQATVNPGTLNAMFDNTATSGLHAVMGTPAARNVMVAQGIQAAPAAGDPAFVGQFRQSDYIAGPGETPSTVTIKFSPSKGGSANINYSQAWGKVVHANGAETAANSAAGIDELASSTKGGYMMYQVFAGNGTATIKVQDASANNDGSFGDLLSSGVIDFSNPTSGVVALATTAAVKQYIRWQLALGTANTVTFALAFVRGY